MKTIELIIDSKGQTTLKTMGFSGSSCRAASAELERALGIVSADTPTAEAHQLSMPTTPLKLNGS